MIMNPLETAQRRIKMGYWFGMYSDGLRLGVWSDFYNLAPGVFKKMKFAWMPDKKIWVGALENGADLVTGLSDLDAVLFPKAIGYALLKKARFHPESFWSAAVRPIFQSYQENRWLFSAPYDPTTNRILKAHHAQWTPDAGGWIIAGTEEKALAILAEAAIPLRDLTCLLPGAPLRRPVGAWTPYLMYVDEDSEEEETALTTIAVGGPRPEKKRDAPQPEKTAVSAFNTPMTLFDVDPSIIDTLTERFDLMPHQKAGVLHFLQRLSALNADDMGLGKTRQTIAAASHLNGCNVVICPASLKDNWAREIQMVLPDMQPLVFENQLPEIQPTWCIVNYERLDSFLSQLKVMDQPWRFSVMAVDEAHNMKEPTAQRTKNTFSLAEYADRKWLLTATPMLNSPAETWTLLRLSGHPVGDTKLRDFNKNFTQTRLDRLELGGRISEWMIRRMKDDFLDLAGKFRSEPVLSVSEEAQARYESFVGDSEINPLAKINFGLQWLEEQKRAPILEMMNDLQPDAKALVFCAYEKTIKWFMDHLPAGSAVRFTGKENRNQRRLAEQTFQENPECRWFIGNIRAAGVGLNLTAATYEFFVSRPWSPRNQFQAEDRAYRIGQDKRVEIYLPIIPDTIDEMIVQLLQDKLTITEEVLVADLENKKVNAKTRPPKIKAHGSTPKHQDADAVRPLF